MLFLNKEKALTRMIGMCPDCKRYVAGPSCWYCGWKEGPSGQEATVVMDFPKRTRSDAGKPRNPSKVRILSSVEAAYVGAFVDGEGTITYLRGKPHAVKVANTEVEHIATLLRLVGDGCVYAHAQSQNRFAKKQIWRWDLTGLANVADLMRQLAPYSLKAQKALVVLSGT